MCDSQWYLRFILYSDKHILARLNPLASYWTGLSGKKTSACHPDWVVWVRVVSVIYHAVLFDYIIILYLLCTLTLLRKEHRRLPHFWQDCHSQLPHRDNNAHSFCLPLLNYSKAVFILYLWDLFPKT